ncbi:MAG TPA: glycosyltransferase [Actinomycetota bacterium]|nr:glycosyltransferase [Actinomycetota bacterium]
MKPSGSEIRCAPALHGVLVTYARPELLERTLVQLAAQTRRLDTLVVVDNDPTPVTREIVSRNPARVRALHYIPTPDNLGPAGGLALGMRQVLCAAAEPDWVVLLDDDDPPEEPDALEELLKLAAALGAVDSRVAGVGLVGARFDWRSGRLVRVRDDELQGPVPVDYLPSGHLPVYRVSAIRDVGGFDERLFFSLDDLEFGLRLRTAGYSLYAHGTRWMEQRRKTGRIGASGGPTIRERTNPSWRRYYSVRNLIYILMRFGRVRAALRVTLLLCFLKPAINLLLSPRRGSRHAALGLRAARDAWLGRMGRTVEPALEAPASVPQRGTKASWN